MEVCINGHLTGPTLHVSEAQNNKTTDQTWAAQPKFGLFLLQVILQPTSILSLYIEPELNQFHSFSQRCPKKTSHLLESRLSI